MLMGPDEGADGGGAAKASTGSEGAAITLAILSTGVVRVRVAETVIGGLVMLTSASGAALGALCSIGGWGGEFNGTDVSAGRSRTAPVGCEATGDFNPNRSAF